jgi:apolipoprotein N-acyltransferase
MSANRQDNRHLSTIWLALSAVTLLSWWIGSSHGEQALTRNIVITYGVMLIAAVKVRLIVSHFMEARHAPLRLRRWMAGWLAFTIVALLAIYSLKLSIPPV